MKITFNLGSYKKLLCVASKTNTKHVNVNFVLAELLKKHKQISLTSNVQLFSVELHAIKEHFVKN